MRAINKTDNKIDISEPFKNLFTQGMVCHETYKDEKGNWLYPEEIIKKDKNTCVKKSDNSKVIVGSSESMSKSKKNTVDPESMIKKYGADSVRWFILSDSPPEKDVQWSDNGVASANKFLQKIWNLNHKIINCKNEKKIDKNLEKNFTNTIDKYVFKIDRLINNFQFNVVIANFYEIYNYFNNHLEKNISKDNKKKNIEKILNLLIPFVPHLARECLQQLNSKKVNLWPKINDKALLENLTNNIVIQVNGTTRDVLKFKDGTEEQKIISTATKESKATKFLKGKSIIKHIYIKSKLVNFVVK